MDFITILLVFCFIGLIVMGLLLNQILRQRNDLKRKLKSHQLEIKNLRIDNRLLEIEKLKYQLHPHTLNNMLGELKSYTNRIQRGMNNLSESLEYILYKGTDHFVTIEEEIEYIEKYIELKKAFMHNSNNIQVEKDNVSSQIISNVDYRIPHLITAYLLENAFKHGDKEQKDFLQVHLVANPERFEFKVVNKIKPIIKTKELNGVGLGNMRERLNLLVGKDRYELKTSCNEFEYHSTLIIKFKK